MTHEDFPEQYHAATQEALQQMGRGAMGLAPFLIELGMNHAQFKITGMIITMQLHPELVVTNEDP